jgi:hypothetical protein
VKRKSPKPREEAFICIFCGHAGHLDEFCFRRKRIERRRVEYARNSYHDEFFDFLPQSYSRAPSRSYSHVSPHTFSRAMSRFSYVPNYHSYGFGSRENRFESRRFGYDPHPCRGNRFSHRPSFPARGSFTYFEPRHLHGPHFPRRGSRPIQPSGEVQRIMKTSSACMVKCWILKIYLTNPSTEPSTPSRPM